jgi:hypothetical protein
MYVIIAYSITVLLYVCKYVCMCVCVCVCVCVCLRVCVRVCVCVDHLSARSGQKAAFAVDYKLGHITSHAQWLNFKHKAMVIYLHAISIEY